MRGVILIRKIAGGLSVSYMAARLYSRIVRKFGAGAPVIVSLTLTSFLTLNQIRLYGHDTRGWVLPARSWFVDMLREGDLPLWFGVVRYGFPTIVAQFSHAFWSPIATVFSFFGAYDATTLSKEFFAWRLIALTGSWMFARSHVRTDAVAWAVGATYIASGSMVTADLQLGVYVGLALMPWVLAGIDRCIDGYSWKSFGFGSGLIGIAGATLLWSAYPGIWLMAPVYLAPYVAVRIMGIRHGRNRLGGIVAIFCGVTLSVIGWIPILIETVRFPIFGDQWRINSDPNLGLLDGWAIVGYFMANPGYIKHSSSTAIPPVYVGVTLATIILIALLSIIINIIYKINKTVLTIILLLLLIYAIIIQSYIIVLIIVLYIFLRSLFLYFPFIITNKEIYIILYIILLYFILNSSEIINKHRQILFPFTFVRWQHYNVYIVNLFIIMISYSIIENNMYIENIKHWRNNCVIYLNYIRTSLLSFILSLSVILIGLAMAVSDSISRIDWQPRGIAVSSLVWTVIIILYIIVLLYYMIHLKNVVFIKQYYYISISFLFLFFIVTMYSWIVSMRPPSWWTYFTMINPIIMIAIDVFQLFIILLILFIIMYKVTINNVLFTIILLNTFDVSIANLRYYSELEIMWNNEIPAKISNQAVGVSRSSISARENIIELATTMPHMWQFPGAMPEVSRVDSEWATPSVFSNFAQFPRDWEQAAYDHDVVVRSVDFRGLTASDREPVSLGKCSEFRDPPSVEMHRFVSTRIDATVTLKCGGLLVWTDSWSPGWKVYINGKMAQVLRVNRAVRGVMMPAGISELRWSYRPPFFTSLILAMGSGIATSLLLLIWAIMGRNSQGALHNTVLN